MSLIRWRRQRLPAVFDEMERMFERLVPRRWWPLEEDEYAFGLAVDVYETDDEVVVKVELPGVGREDVNVTAQEDAVVIDGRSKQEEEVEEEGYHRRELRYGSFHRAVPLPATVNPDEVQAKFADGVLTIRAPKAPAPEAGKKIEIE